MAVLLAHRLFKRRLKILDRIDYALLAEASPGARADMDPRFAPAIRRIALESRAVLRYSPRFSGAGSRSCEAPLGHAFCEPSGPA